MIAVKLFHDFIILYCILLSISSTKMKIKNHTEKSIENMNSYFNNINDV